MLRGVAAPKTNIILKEVYIFILFFTSYKTNTMREHLVTNNFGLDQEKK